MVPGCDPKVDYAFKKVFGTEDNTPVLLNLLDAVLRPPTGQRLIHLDILNPFNEKDALDDKLSILDIKARDQQSRQYNVGMQMRARAFIRSRYCTKGRCRLMILHLQLALS